MTGVAVLAAARAAVCIAAWVAALVTTLGLAGARPLSAQAPRPAPSVDGSTSPSTRRAQEVMALINAADPARIAAYVDTAFSAELSADPLASHVTFVLSEWERSRGLDWRGVEQEEPGFTAGYVRRRLTGRRMALLVATDSAAPYHIVGYGMRTPPVDPDEPLLAARSDRAMADDLQQFVQALAAADAFSGTVLLARDGQVLFAGAVGQANKDAAAPLSLDARLNVGSMNKLFTAVAVLQLAERGALTLDDTLGRFLPAGTLRPEVLARVRLAHLLSHTSGLGDIHTAEFDRSARSRFRTVDAVLQLVRDDSLRFSPGTRWSYSNAGFAIIGKVIEVASGESYHDYVRAHVYRTAGMTASDSYDLDRVVPHRAVGYDKRFAADGTKSYVNTDYWHMVRGSAAGGAYATAGDLLRFAEALKGGRLVSPASLALMTAPRPELGSPGYGYGVQLRPAVRAFGHGGGAPGVSANLEIHQAGGYVAIVLSNYGGSAADPVLDRMRALIAARHAETRANER